MNVIKYIKNTSKSFSNVKLEEQVLQGFYHAIVHECVEIIIFSFNNIRSSFMSHDYHIDLLLCRHTRKATYVNTSV